MYNHILAAINEHVNSEIAARYAAHLAKTAGARLTLCSIREDGHAGRAFDLAKEASRRIAHRAKELGVPTECVFGEGDPVEEIRAIARAQGADLVFASTRREDVSRRFFTRTIARKLSLRLPCSVALVRVVHLGRPRPRTVLAPLKARIGHLAEHAAFVGLMAAAFDARIFLLHATKPLLKFFHGEVHLTPGEWESRMPDDVSRFIKFLSRYDVGHEKSLVPGVPGHAITIEASARRHDLIIMGASERGLLKSLIRGNPVERVLRETPCDLIILRPGKTNKTAT